MPVEPRENRIIVCEELNFVWDEPQLTELKRLWSEGYTINQIAKSFRRLRDEIVIALLEVLDEYGKAELFEGRWGVHPRRRRIALCID